MTNGTNNSDLDRALAIMGVDLDAAANEAECEAAQREHEGAVREIQERALDARTYPRQGGRDRRAEVMARRAQRQHEAAVRELHERDAAAYQCRGEVGGDYGVRRCENTSNGPDGLCEECRGGYTREPKKAAQPKKAAGDLKCNRCQGTGTYRWGAIVNGRPSKSGECFKCNGTGVSTPDSRREFWRESEAHLFSGAM